MTELEKMLAGKIYDAGHPKLVALRVKAHNLCKKYNDTFEDETEKRAAILDELLPDKKGPLFLQGPIFFDYGIFTSFGKNFYANYNFCVLDCNRITIGDDVMIGTNCSLIAPVHPMRYQDRTRTHKEDGTRFAPEFSRPVVIGDNCWLASNVTVTGGVHIGNGCVIGAGSVVVNDIPDNSFAAGVPCRRIREITGLDAIQQKKELW